MNRTFAFLNANNRGVYTNSFPRKQKRKKERKKEKERERERERERREEKKKNMWILYPS